VEQAGLTVVTWNAQGGRGLDVARSAAALHELAPDVVLLQEIQRRQLGALRAALDALDACWRFKHWPVPGRAEGLGVLAGVPMADTRVQVLAQRWRFWSWRRRIAVLTSLDVDGRTVRIADVHLGAGVTHEERGRQARLLLERADGVALIAGDLNAEPGAPELLALSDAGWTDAEARVRPAGTPRPSSNWDPGPRTSAPTQRLDYVLVRAVTPVQHAYVPDDWARWAELSDHLPVVARVEL
jgi:endonuclease/exonuclease/phosphatase family metal-dependent hydrolase